MASIEKELFREELAKRQQVIAEAKIPVIVILEGWGTAGKGSAIKSMIKYMDPRYYRVYNMDVMSEDEKRRPFLYRHAIRMPKQGQFSIYDGGLMDETVTAYLMKDISKAEYKRRIDSTVKYERQLRDNGYLVLKFFLDIDKKTQSQRIDRLMDKKNSKWRVSAKDVWQNINYDEYKKQFDKYIKKTDTVEAPWHIISGDDMDTVERYVATTIVSAIDAAVANPWKAKILDNKYPMVDFKGLSSIPLAGKSLTEEEYGKKLKSLQKKLSKLGDKLYKKGVPLIIAYEGWDAAGKGGNIKRVASALDPRDFEVHPIASPTPDEKNRHFLWRFYNRLPKTGHTAIFDRTWYGRVMVERLEGFCSENDWQRAYNEMNEFEKDLTDWGAIVIKFWVQIDKDTQLERFNDRQNTPSKMWKITDEDWRNREKWDLYETAVNEMIKKTNTQFAPWYILESVDKKYARIKALEIIIDRVESVIGDDSI